MHLSRPEKRKNLRDHILYGVYDLSSAPPSYEIISFLLLCELARRAQELIATHVLFVPGPDQGFRGNKKEITNEANEWRRDHILSHACDLIGATHSFLPDPKEMEEYEGCFLWQPGWSLSRRETWYGHRILMQMYGSIDVLPELRVSPYASGKVREWTKEKPYITITKRNAHAVARNSKDDVWNEFSEWVENQGYRAITIPDTNDAALCDPIGSIASIDLRFRHALYAGAITNFGINTGPMVLCYYSGFPFVACHMTSPGWVSTSPEYVAKHVTPIGTQFPGARLDQVLVWEDENLPMLKREFSRQIEMKKAA